jgi:hypothetical protein
MRYVVIGLDGWECGPLTLEEINQALAGGRFSLNCLVRESEGGRWRRAREIAGVAGSGIPVALADGSMGFPGAPPAAVPVTELRQEQVGPFVLQFLPTCSGVAEIARRLWAITAGSATSVIRVAGSPNCVILSRDHTQPIALGAVFPINGRGWVRVPPAAIRKVIRASKPLPPEASTCLERLYERLSTQLFLEGEACGLIRFTNGAGMRVDMREQAENLAIVLYKVTFLKPGSFSPSEYDPSGDCPWPADTGITSINYGEKRADGWSSFFLLVQAQPPDLRDY